MKIIDMPDLTEISIDELEKLLDDFTKKSMPVVDELCKRYKQIKETQNIKKAS